MAKQNSNPTDCGLSIVPSTFLCQPSQQQTSFVTQNLIPKSYSRAMEVSGRPADDCSDENERPRPVVESSSSSKASGSKWADVQQKLLVPIRATLNFRTLRDMYGEVMLEPEKLVYVSELGGEWYARKESSSAGFQGGRPERCWVGLNLQRATTVQSPSMNMWMKMATSLSLRSRSSNQGWCQHRCEET